MTGDIGTRRPCSTSAWPGRAPCGSGTVCTCSTSGCGCSGPTGSRDPRPASELSAGAAARTRFFSTRHAPWAFYGYEAMALARDAMAAGGDRAGVVAALRSTRDRDSPLGRYSIDEHGLTTSTAYAALEVVGGEIVWGRA